MKSFTLKRPDSFQNYNKRKATRGFAPTLLILKIQQEVSKFKDICVSLSS